MRSTAATTHVGASHIQRGHPKRPSRLELGLTLLLTGPVLGLVAAVACGLWVEVVLGYAFGLAAPPVAALAYSWLRGWGTRYGLGLAAAALALGAATVVLAIVVFLASLDFSEV